LARMAGRVGVLGVLAAASLVRFTGVAQAAPGAPLPHGAAMYGDPDAAAPYWRRQHGSNCAEIAVADVIGEVTGREPTEQEIDATAENTPSPFMPGGSVWHPGAPSEIRDLPALLAHYGIDSRAIQTNIDVLESELARGHKVIAAVNSQILWNGGGNRKIVDHFVVVTGIDTDANVVHLNDSGIDTGSDEQVPLATFENSWATSNKQAVVTK
jgi:hypothetical protein